MLNVYRKEFPYIERIGQDAKLDQEVRRKAVSLSAFLGTLMFVVAALFAMVVGKFDAHFFGGIAIGWGMLIAVALTCAPGISSEQVDEKHEAWHQSAMAK